MTFLNKQVACLLARGLQSNLWKNNMTKTDGSKSGFNTNVCSTESVDEGLSFSSGRLWSNTMVSVLARQNPLDRMISKRYRVQYWISCEVIVTLRMSAVESCLCILDIYLISWLDSESMAGFCGLCRSSAPDPAAIAQRKSTWPLTWNTVESSFQSLSPCSCKFQTSKHPPLTHKQDVPWKKKWIC